MTNLNWSLLSRYTKKALASHLSAAVTIVLLLFTSVSFLSAEEINVVTENVVATENSADPENMAVTEKAVVPGNVTVAESDDNSIQSSVEAKQKIIAVEKSQKQGLIIPRTQAAPGVDSGAWLSAILGLIAVIALIFLVAWFVKRFSGITMGHQQQQLRIVSAISVGTRERIALIEVADKQLLVGITQQNINLLHSFDEPVVNKNDKTGADFSSRLQSILSKSTSI